MAKKDVPAVDTAENPTPTPVPKRTQTMYTAAELIAAAPQAFNVSSAIAAGALYGVTEATKDDAKTRIEAFKTKTIKGAK